MSTSVASATPLRRRQAQFVIAWVFCVIFYFAQYALRSSPGVMHTELTAAFGLTTLGISSLIGLYYYTYSVFALVAGAALDRHGAKYVIPGGIVLLAVGSIGFGLGAEWTAQVGRLLQGAGAAFAFVGAVYLAAHGFSAAYLATAIGFTQCIGMLGGSAGQFSVAPLIHGPMTWQHFWIYSGLILVVLALLTWMATPGGHDPGQDARASVIGPYKRVLSNPQSYLCGIIAGFLFLPTTIGDMIWGVPFLRNSYGLDYASAVNHATTVPFGWVIGCPLLGYIADKIGRRKPVLIAGSVVMLVSAIAILYLPPDSLALYIYGVVFGIGSGAAMIPYSVIKEVNPDEVKGSATGAMNFLVFTLSALMAPGFGWLLMHLAGGAPLGLGVFREAGNSFLVLIAVATVLAFFLRETGRAAHERSARAKVS